MSAFIVSKQHIDALVTGVLMYCPDAGDAEKLGRMLWRENYRSVNYRYGERSVPPRYSYRPQPLEPAALVKAVQCYDYQSCEHPGWESSEARALILKLESLLLARLRVSRDAVFNLPDYKAAPWGI